MNNGIYTTAEIAEILHVQPRTIRNLKAKGMPHFKALDGRPRYDLRKIANWLRRQQPNRATRADVERILNLTGTEIAK